MIGLNIINKKSHPKMACALSSDTSEHLAKKQHKESPICFSY